MRTKRRGDERLEQHGAAALFPFSGAAIVCADCFTGIRHFGKAETGRTREIRGVVVRDVSAGGRRAGLADVPVFTLKTARIPRIAESFIGCYRK